MRWLVLVGVFGCGNPASTQDAGTGSDAIDAPRDAGPAVQHVYVGDDNANGGITRFTLPLTATTPPDFTISAPFVFELAFDATGNLIGGDQNGKINIFKKPVVGSSFPSVSFKNGTATNGGQIVLASDGSLFASGQAATINVFTPPFTDSSVPSRTIANAAITSVLGIALDGANLIVNNGGTKLIVLPPPYNAPSAVTAAVTGVAYRKMAVTGGRLFVSSIAPSTGRIDVYTLPITNASVPAFSITNGVHGPEAIAVDKDGRLHVGNITDHTVSRYSPPFTAASNADVILAISATQFTIFGLAIDP